MPSTEIQEPDPIDRLEASMLTGVKADIRSIHDFFPGIYRRGCVIPPGTLIVSEMHRTEHPFVITDLDGRSGGEVHVFSLNEGPVKYRAPHHGTTLPGTRRVLYTATGIVWTTYHPNPDECRDVKAIVERIIHPNANPLLPEEVRALGGWQSQVPPSLVDGDKDQRDKEQHLTEEKA